MMKVCRFNIQKDTASVSSEPIIQGSRTKESIPIQHQTECRNTAQASIAISFQGFEKHIIQLSLVLNKENTT